MRLAFASISPDAYVVPWECPAAFEPQPFPNSILRKNRARPYGLAQNTPTPTPRGVCTHSPTTHGGGIDTPFTHSRRSLRVVRLFTRLARAAGGVGVSEHRQVQPGGRGWPNTAGPVQVFIGAWPDALDLSGQS